MTFMILILFLLQLRKGQAKEASSSIHSRTHRIATIYLNSPEDAYGKDTNSFVVDTDSLNSAEVQRLIY